MVSPLVCGKLNLGTCGIEDEHVTTVSGKERELVVVENIHDERTNVLPVSP